MGVESKKPVVYHIDDYAFGFSIDEIKRRFKKKGDFVEEVVTAHPEVDKAKLEKLLDKIWGEAFPQK